MTTYAVSATYNRFDHMSLTAAAMAVLLHILMAVALWLVSPLNQHDIEVEPIEVTFEKPPAPEVKPPEPAPTPAPTPTPSPAPQAAVQTPPPALPPPAPKQVGPESSLRVLPPPATTTEKPKEPPQPPPETKPETKPEAKPEEKSEPPQAETKKAEAKAEEAKPEEAKPQEKPTPPAPPRPKESEQILPSLQAPAAPAKAPAEVAKPAPPPPPVQHQQAHVAPPPPAAPQQLAPSPLTNPRRAPSQQSAAAAPSPEFVNPATKYEQARIVDQYLWQVVQRIAQYRYAQQNQNQGDVVVLRLVIARDGRLVDVSIVKSSGSVTVDKGLIEAARAGSPYPPLPSELPGAQIPFVQPFAPVYRRQ
ncbi:MAG TPA: TonB family protein [Reyranella sp.]|nr:TonB family protein [Reyranella sp.]